MPKGAVVVSGGSMASFSPDSQCLSCMYRCLLALLPIDFEHVTTEQSTHIPLAYQMCLRADDRHIHNRAGGPRKTARQPRQLVIPGTASAHKAARFNAHLEHATAQRPVRALGLDQT